MDTSFDALTAQSEALKQAHDKHLEESAPALTGISKAVDRLLEQSKATPDALCKECFTFVVQQAYKRFKDRDPHVKLKVGSGTAIERPDGSIVYHIVFHIPSEYHLLIPRGDGFKTCQRCGKELNANG